MVNPHPETSAPVRLKDGAEPHLALTEAQAISARGVTAPPRVSAAHALDGGRTLVDIFHATVLRAPGRCALAVGQEELTYGALADAAKELAARLRARHVGPGDRVGVRIASGTAALYIAILGVLEAGAAYVPVDADDSPARASDLRAGRRLRDRGRRLDHQPGRAGDPR